MKIGVINTGGTISCVGSPLSPMTAKEFSDACTTILNPVIRNEFKDIDIDYITDLTFPGSKGQHQPSANRLVPDGRLYPAALYDIRWLGRAPRNGQPGLYRLGPAVPVIMF
ncbi:MAG: hypothetical protein VST71_08945 [Nitrospirota bacterium]|nr:hypothetical protein [Nitrospirota bacterium]